MSDTSRLRPLDAPRPIQVRTGAHDTPLQVRPARTWLRVESIRERWRIDDEWWRKPIHRIYHEVVLEDGRISTLYRDCTDGRWYLHGGSPRTPRTPGRTSNRASRWPAQTPAPQPPTPSASPWPADS